jgi:hypothetical protein
MILFRYANVADRNYTVPNTDAVVILYYLGKMGKIHMEGWQESCLPSQCYLSPLL